MKTGSHSNLRARRPFKYVPKAHSAQTNRQQSPKGLRINEATTEALSELHICPFCDKKFKFKLLCFEHQNKCLKKTPGPKAHEAWPGYDEPMTDEQLLAVLSSASPPRISASRESPKKPDDFSARFTLECGEKSAVSEDAIEEFVEIDLESVEDPEESSHSDIEKSQTDSNFGTDTSTEITVKANKAQVLDLVSKPLSILRKYGLYLENSPEPVEIETLRKYGIYLEDCPKVCDNQVPDSDVNNNVVNDLTGEKAKKVTEMLVAESSLTKRIGNGKHRSKHSPELSDIAGKVRPARKSVGILDPLTKPSKKASSVKLLSKRSNSLRAVKSSDAKDMPKLGKSSKEIKCIEFADTLKSDEQIEVSVPSKIALDEHPVNVQSITVELQNIVGPSKVLKQTKILKSAESVESLKRNSVTSEVVDHSEVPTLSGTVESPNKLENVRCSKRIQTQRFKSHKPFKSIDLSIPLEPSRTVYLPESLNPSTTLRPSEVDELSDSVEFLEVETCPEIVSQPKRGWVSEKSLELVGRAKHPRFKEPPKIVKPTFPQKPTKIVEPLLVQDPPENFEPSEAAEPVKFVQPLKNRKRCETIEPSKQRKCRKPLKTSELAKRPVHKKQSKCDVHSVEPPEIHAEVSGIRATVETVKPNRGSVKGPLTIVKPSSIQNTPLNFERSEDSEPAQSPENRKLLETMEASKQRRDRKPFKNSESSKRSGIRKLFNRKEPSVIQNPPEKGILATPGTVRPKRDIVKGPLKIVKPSFVQDSPEHFESSGAPTSDKSAESLVTQKLYETVEPPKQRRGRKSKFVERATELHIKELTQREKSSAIQGSPAEHTELPGILATSETVKPKRARFNGPPGAQAGKPSEIDRATKPVETGELFTVLEPPKQLRIRELPAQTKVPGMRNFPRAVKSPKLDNFLGDKSRISKALERRGFEKPLKTEKSQKQLRFGRYSGTMESLEIDDLDEILDVPEFWEPFDAIPPSRDENLLEMAHPAKDRDFEVAGPSKVSETLPGSAASTEVSDIVEGLSGQVPVTLGNTKSSSVRLHADPPLVKVNGMPEAVPSADDASKIVLAAELFPCMICLEDFPTALDLLEHSRGHTYPKILLTTEQVKSFYRLDDRSICPICTKPLQGRYRSSFIKHLHTHIDLPQYTCPVCKSDFRRLDHMKAHLRRHILPEK